MAEIFNFSANFGFLCRLVYLLQLVNRVTLYI